MFDIVRALHVLIVVCFSTQATQTHVIAANDYVGFQVFHVESRISSIAVNWTSNVSFSNYQVRARSLISGITLIAPTTNDTEYTMMDLIIDTPYEICVAAVVSGLKALHQPVVKMGRSVEACIELRTIPLVRIDSVMVLFGVIAFVFLSIVAALLCWKCSKKEDVTRIEVTSSDYKGNENGFESNEMEAEIKKISDEAERPLLANKETEKVNSQSSPEMEFLSETQPQSNLQSNPSPQSDRPTAV